MYEDSPHADTATAIGLLGANVGERSSITAALTEREYAYEQVDTLHVRDTHAVGVYEYDRDGETRYVAEAIDRVAIDEVRYHSFVFDDRPDADAVSQAALIEEVRLGRGDG